MEGTPRYFAGIDWASAKHDACVLDAQGQTKALFSIPHTAEGLADLIRRLRRFGKPEELPISIERPSGLLVDTLLEAGFPVVPIHPNALKATRPRYSAAPGKSDPGDAYILADVLRTDGHRFRPLRDPSDQTRALRAAVRTRDDLVATRVQLANQLRSLLDSFWPGAIEIFADVDSPIALAFLDRYPTPESASRLGPTRMERFLRSHAYCGRRSPDALLERLRSAPVTNTSGKHRAVACRFACNKRLRKTLTTWADNSRHAHPWAASVYRDARARGCDHPHAIRILARAWCRVLWRCWQDHTPYDITRHRRARPFLQRDPQLSSAAA